MDAVREVVDMSTRKFRRAIAASIVIALGDGFPRYEGDVDLSKIGQWIRNESIDHKLENVTFFLVHQTCQEKLGGSRGGDPYCRRPFFSFVEKMMRRLNQSCALVQIGGDVYRIEL